MQPASSGAVAYAMFTVGLDSHNYYRLFVTGSTLVRSTLRLISGLAVAIVLVCSALPAQAQVTEVVEYYGLDEIGSIRVVFDANGAIVSRRDYEPFGKPVTPIGSDPKLFAALFRDDESGQDYAQARMYHSRTGRFNAPDPVFAIGDPHSSSRYACALNSPTIFTDTSGLCVDQVRLEECISRVLSTLAWTLSFGRYPPNDTQNPPGRPGTGPSRGRPQPKPEEPTPSPNPNPNPNPPGPNPEPPDPEPPKALTPVFL